MKNRGRVKFFALRYCDLTDLKKWVGSFLVLLHFSYSMLRLSSLLCSLALFASCSAWSIWGGQSQIDHPACQPPYKISLTDIIDISHAQDDSTTHEKNLNITIKTQHQLQELPLSCEASTMTEWYNFIRAKEGKYPVTESFIRSKIPSYSLPLSRDPYGQLVWGDPDFGFVGDIMGRQSSSVSRMTGYGIHARGIERATKRLFERLGYEIVRVKRSDEIIMTSLQAWYPVFAYYISTPYPPGAPYFLDWKSPTGRKIRGYVGEHVGLIVGVKTDHQWVITHIRLTEWRSEWVVEMGIDEWRERSQWFGEYIQVLKK